MRLLLFLFLLSLLYTLSEALHHRGHHNHHHHMRRRAHRLRRKVPSHRETITAAAVPVVLWHGMGDSCCNPLSMGSIKKLIEANVPGVYVKSLKLGENIASVPSHRETITAAAVPVVLWHGMGDSCCNPLSMGSIKKLIEANVPGVYVKSLKLGENIASDTERGFLANMNDLVELACQQIKNDTMLKAGYSAVGFSQGGQFIRALAERCPEPPMRNLISIGGQQQGIFGLPYCPGDTIICNTIRRLLDIGAYVGFVQNSVVQAQYWHDPLNEEAYKKKNIFLADINNEKEYNADYKKNLLKIKNMVLVRFTKDNMVVPRESSWFGYYEPGSLSKIQWMNETTLYKEDRIGLRKLDESGRLHFLAVDGDHLQIPRETFVEEIINKYLK